MLRTITRLLFGGEEDKTPEDDKSGEVVEEGWLVVNHQAGNQEAEVLQQSNTALYVEPVTQLETDTSTTTSSSTSSDIQAVMDLVSQPKTLAEVTQLTSVQKAKSCVDRHYMSRNAIQRQNRVHQGYQHHAFHLQQPGHRNLSH
ncbi:hypothetical protein PAMA_011001 [Pampus argenteus]